MHVPGAASVGSVDVSGVNLRLEALVDRPLEEPKGADRYDGPGRERREGRRVRGGG